MSEAAAAEVAVVDSGAVGASALVDGPAAAAAAAAAKHATLMSDEKYRSAYLAGDKEKLEEVRALFRQMVPAQEDPAAQAVARNAAAIEQKINSYLRVADIPSAVQQQLRENTPVTLQERQLALHELGRLKGDKEFVRQLFDGSRAARTKWSLVHIILGSPIAEQRP